MHSRLHADSAHGESPSLVRHAVGAVAVHLDEGLWRDTGILVAFSERGGGYSRPPFDSLNLAAHVGDDPASVDGNRLRLLEALGLGELRGSMVTARQVHGTDVARVARATAGAGAFSAGQPGPEADALVTTEAGIPLLMLYADCVPVIVVAESPRRAVAVVHSGWRGTAERVVTHSISELLAVSGARPESLRAYIGPHIRSCCYEVDETLASHFGNIFDTITAVDGRLDMEAAVRESMEAIGVKRERVTSLGLCTHDLTDRFFSYRAHQVTGRHGALAVITKVE